MNTFVYARTCERMFPAPRDQPHIFDSDSNGEQCKYRALDDSIPQGTDSTWISLSRSNRAWMRQLIS